MLHSITGLMSSGKTLYLTLKGFQEFASGKIVYSNYDLNFPHIKINKDFLIDLATKEYELKNACFLLDEMWIWMDSRASMSNRVISYFFLQSSKDDSRIYITAQHSGQQDKRLRDNLHRVSNCSRVIIKDGKKYNIDDEDRFLPKEFHPYLYIKIKEFKRVNFMGYSDLLPAGTLYIPASVIFPLYDTTQKIRVKP